MKKIVFFALLVVSFSIYAQEVTLKSPDGNIGVQIKLGKKSSTTYSAAKIYYWKSVLHRWYCATKYWGSIQS